MRPRITYIHLLWLLLLLGSTRAFAEQANSYPMYQFSGLASTKSLSLLPDIQSTPHDGLLVVLSEKEFEIENTISFIAVSVCNFVYFSANHERFNLLDTM